MAIIQNVQQTRDEIGTEDTVDRLYPSFAEALKLTTEIEKSTVNMGNSFVLEHDTLGRLRVDKNAEADCSSNSNVGTWTGSNIGGEQFAADANVLGWWKTEGDATDTSGNGSDLTVSGATLDDGPTGESEGSYLLDGITDNLTLASFTPSDEFTVFGSFKASSLTDFDRIFNYLNGATNRIYVGFKSNKLWYRVGDLADTEADTTLSTDTWYFFTLTYKSGNAQIYLNGVTDDTQQSGITFDGTNAETIYFGTNQTTSNPFEGNLANLGFIDKELSESQVALLYAEKNPFQVGYRLSGGYFNGTDNYIAADNYVVTTTGDFTISVVINPTNTDEGMIIANGDNTNGFYIYDRNTYMRIRLGATNHDFNGYSRTVGSNSVIQVTWDSSASELSLYVDGTLIETKTSVTWSNAADNDLLVGVWPGGIGGALHWEGMIDEAIIFDTVLDSDGMEEIRDNAFDSNSSNYSDCLIWWSMDNPLTGDRRGKQVKIN